jgi:hypothetical protein
MNPVSPQIAQDAKPAKSRRVNITTSLLVRLASVRTSTNGIIIALKLSRQGAGDARAEGEASQTVARIGQGAGISFEDQAHLDAIVSEARDIVNNALGSPDPIPT